MLWFKTKKKTVTPESELLTAKITAEIASHKKKSEVAIANANSSKDKLDGIINRNGFTLKVHIAAGGKYHGN